MSAERSRVITNSCDRKQRFSFSKRLYRLRWRIENAFNRLKDFRRIATRYDRLALNYLAFVWLDDAALCNMTWIVLMSEISFDEQLRMRCAVDGNVARASC